MTIRSRLALCWLLAHARLGVGLFALWSFGCAHAQQAAQTPVATASNVAAGPKLQARIDALVRKTKRDLVFVKGGVFQMGDFGLVHSPEKLPYTGQPEARPLHEVELDNFSIGRFKVTYEDFDVYTDAVGLPRIATAPFDAQYRTVPKVPAGVNWPEAKAYCKWLGSLTHLAFDLPSEAQWEFAARNRGQFVLWATNNGRYQDGKNVASYDQKQQMMLAANMSSVSNAYPVGRYPASPLGLYDMGLNGWDWVDDWFDADYYEQSPRKNPRGSLEGTEKVQRGIDGGAADTALTMYRQKRRPIKKPSMDSDGVIDSDRSNASGFRCAVNEPRAVAR